MDDKNDRLLAKKKTKLKVCAYCEKEHYGKQIFNKILEEYVCIDCNKEIK